MLIRQEESRNTAVDWPPRAITARTKGCRACYGVAVPNGDNSWRCLKCDREFHNDHTPVARKKSDGEPISA